MRLFHLLLTLLLFASMALISACAGAVSGGDDDTTEDVNAGDDDVDTADDDNGDDDASLVGDDDAVTDDDVADDDAAGDDDQIFDDDAVDDDAVGDDDVADDDVTGDDDLVMSKACEEYITAVCDCYGAESKKCEDAKVGVEDIYAIGGEEQANQWCTNLLPFECDPTADDDDVDDRCKADTDCPADFTCNLITGDCEPVAPTDDDDDVTVPENVEVCDGVDNDGDSAVDDVKGGEGGFDQEYTTLIPGQPFEIPVQGMTLKGEVKDAFLGFQLVTDLNNPPKARLDGLGNTTVDIDTGILGTRTCEITMTIQDVGDWITDDVFSGSITEVFFCCPDGLRLDRLDDFTTFEVSGDSICDMANNPNVIQMLKDNMAQAIGQMVGSCAP